MTKDEIIQCLRTQFPDEEIKVLDLKGDGQYIEIHVASPQFKGLAMIDQHRLVMASLKGKAGTAIHAVTLKTKAI